MPEKIWFTNRSLIEKNDVPWIASLIIHEAFHATQFKNGAYVASLDKLESPAFKVQAGFLKKLEGMGGITAVESVKKNKYWEKMAGDTKSYAHFRNLLKHFENQKPGKFMPKSK